VKTINNALVVSHESGLHSLYKFGEESGMVKAAEYKESGPSYEFDVFQADGHGYVLSTSKDQAVHMWDTEGAKFVTQFVCRNQVEEVISPLAVRAN
jgi:hypothetical protein